MNLLTTVGPGLPGNELATTLHSLHSVKEGSSAQPGAARAVEARSGGSEITEQTDGECVRGYQAYLRALISRMSPGTSIEVVARGFIATYHPVIVAVCKKHPRPGLDAEDLAQEIWIKLNAKLLSFEYDEKYPSIKNWIQGFARRELRDRPTGAREPVFQAGGSDISLGLYLSRSPDPAAEYEANEVRRIVACVLIDVQRTVTPTSWQVFALRIFERLTHAEIAERLGVKAHQSRKRFHSVMNAFDKSLRSCLAFADA
jgi:RNA polymerase sigma factor (sigma-70 family)